MTGQVHSSLADGITVITLSRPEKRNAFNQALREGLAREIEKAVDEVACKGVLITGEGAHFSVGGDADVFEQMTPSDLPDLLGAAHRCVTAIRQTRKPVIAAVEGYAAGGATGLILACDAVVAAESAKFAFPFLNLGLVPDWGCVHFLQEKVGKGTARKILMRSSVLSGQEAFDAGVVDDLCETGQALSVAGQLMQRYMRLPGEAWGYTKAMLNADCVNLQQALAHEQTYQEACFGAPAFRHAMEVFMGKRASRA